MCRKYLSSLILSTTLSMHPKNFLSFQKHVTKRTTHKGITEMTKTYKYLAAGVAVTAVLYGCGYLSTVLMIAACGLSVVMGVVAGLSMVLCTGEMQRATEPDVQPSVATLLLTRMMVSTCVYSKAKPALSGHCHGRSLTLQLH